MSQLHYEMRLGVLGTGKSHPAKYDWHGSSLSEYTNGNGVVITNGECIFAGIASDIHGNSIDRIPPQHRIKDVQVINPTSGAVVSLVEGVGYNFVAADNVKKASIQIVNGFAPTDADIFRLVF